MMNESLIRLVTALAGKWKEEHLVPVMPKAEVEFVTTRCSILSSAAKICARTRSPAALKKKKKRGSGGREVRGQNGSAFWAVSGPRARRIKKI